MNQDVHALLAGNDDHVHAVESAFEGLQDGQAPPVVTVCCSDSRVLQDGMWRNDEPGRIFTCGNIGNRVVQDTEDGQVVSGDVLYPVAHAGTETIVVVGHTGCGAVTATYDALTDGVADAPGIEHCIGLLKPHLAEGVDALPDGLSREEAINHLVEYNVDRQIDVLRESKHVPDETDVLGVVYDFQDIYSENRGEVHVVNIDGTRDVEALRSAYPELADRIARQWHY